MVGGFVRVKLRIVRVPQDERELRAAVPVVWYFRFREAFEIERAGVGIILA